MSDATDVRDDLAEEDATDGGRPTSFLPSPTFPAAMLADGDGDGDGDGDAGGSGEEPAPAPVFAAAPEAKPDKPGLLIRLGHRFCGRPNGTA